MDGNGNVRFYLPFDNFATPPTFRDTNDYLEYKHHVINFIQSRNSRIADYAGSIDPPHMIEEAKTILIEYDKHESMSLRTRLMEVGT